MKLLYPAILEEEKEGGYLVTFPDLPEAGTDGETLEEAIYNASEVLTLTLECRVEGKEEIPEPSEIETAQYIAPSARVQAAILIKLARKDKSLSDVARTLNTSWAAAQRLENPKHWTNLQQLEKTAAVLGKQVVIELT